MGIYPSVKVSQKITWANGGISYWLLRDDFTGQNRRRLVLELPWQLDPRTHCFCCTCEDEWIKDAWCRNHGFVGERPCEYHNLPGSEDWELYGSKGEWPPQYGEK